MASKSITTLVLPVASAPRTESRTAPAAFRVVIGPPRSVVNTNVPEGTLFDVNPDGEVVATGVTRESWPTGWEPDRGDMISAGHLATGGLVIGTVDTVEDGGLTVRRFAPDPARAVKVIGP